MSASKVSDREIVERTSVIIQKGISGFVYGRNVIQYPITQAMLTLLHKKATVEQTVAILA